MSKRFKKSLSVILSVLFLVAMVNVGIVAANDVPYEVKTYTTKADFSQGEFTNTVKTSTGEVKLDDTTAQFDFIWVAVSSRGTIVKIDTRTGEVLGEYWTSPSGQPKNPSRTTVDNNGSVWVANRDGHSVTRVCLPESGLWVDRNDNGVCDTSTGLGDIKAWTNAGGADSAGGVSTAEDECIINYILVSSSGTRHVSIDADNDVWVSGINSRIFNKIDGVTGAIVDTRGPFDSAGGYGGLIDSDDVIWSETSGNLLRWDTAGDAYTTYPGSGYGLGIDSQGNIWNSSYGGTNIRKFSPAGVLLGSYNQGYIYAQGCVAGLDDDIWVAHSLNQGSGAGSVGHLNNDGTLVGNVTGLPSGPTGVAVDAEGYIWATCYSAGKVVRIDPKEGPDGSDGSPVGAVDLTVNVGGYLYNYSDMTGSTLLGTANAGTWSIIYDSGNADAKWVSIDWNGIISGNGALGVKVASSTDGTNFSPLVDIEEGQPFVVPEGRYLKVSVNFTRSTEGDKESPILEDITVGAEVAIAFDPNGNSDAAGTAATAVTLAGGAENYMSSEYQWSTSPEFPTEGTWTPFSSGDTIGLSEVTGDYYLHVKATDISENTITATSNKFVLGEGEEEAITFNPNGDSDAGSTASTTVTLAGGAENYTSSEYQWSKKSAFPTDGTWTSFVSGERIRLSGVSGDYYLHVRATDASEDTITATSNKFDLRRSSDSGGGGIVVPPEEDVTAPEEFITETVRYAGANRFETAVAISKAGWEQADTVILARNDDFADSLSGVPLAYKLNAPILLTNTADLPNVVAQEIQRLKASKAIILGEWGAVSTNVADQVTALGLKVERIGGLDRFGTAAKIAPQVIPAEVKTAVIVNGYSFADALAMSSYAAVRGYPILQVNTDNLPADTAAALTNLGITQTVVAGYAGVVAENVFAQLPSPVRYGDTNRYGTALALAKEFAPAPTEMFIATGRDFPDSIAGAVLAAKRNSGILFVPGNLEAAPYVDAGVLQYIIDKQVRKLNILGGPGAVNEATLNSLANPTK